MRHDFGRERTELPVTKRLPYKVKVHPASTATYNGCGRRLRGLSCDWRSRAEGTVRGRVALARHPDDRDILLALVSYSRDAGDFGTALEYAERMACVTPGDPGLVALIEKLRQQAKEPGTR